MYSARSLLYLTVIGAVIAFSIHKRNAVDVYAASEAETKGSNVIPADSIHVTAIGSDQIDCKDVYKTVLPPPTREVRLHIPSTIFSALAAKTPITCIDPATQQAAPSCVSVYDNGVDTYRGGAVFTGSVDNWRTPLDLDIYDLLQTDTTLYIRIILEDKNLHFLHRRSDTKTDWSVTQGKEGSGMFYCLDHNVTPATATMGESIRLSVTNKIPQAGVPAANWAFQKNYGGLNIGILVPDPDATKPRNRLPIYIDPQIHNNG